MLVRNIDKTVLSTDFFFFFKTGQFIVQGARAEGGGMHSYYPHAPRTYTIFPQSGKEAHPVLWADFHFDLLF